MWRPGKDKDKEKQQDDLPLVSGISPLQLDVGKNVVDDRKKKLDGFLHSKRCVVIRM